MKYLVRNARDEAVTVNVRQSGLWRDGKVIEESLKSTSVDAYTLQWPVPVPANGQTTLTFTVETGLVDMLRLCLSLILWLTCAAASADFVSLSPQNVELDCVSPRRFTRAVSR